MTIYYLLVSCYTDADRGDAEVIPKSVDVCQVDGHCFQLEADRNLTYGLLGPVKKVIK